MTPYPSGLRSWPVPSGKAPSRGAVPRQGCARKFRADRRVIQVVLMLRYRLLVRRAGATVRLSAG
jgi:hypothetical protein